MIPLLAPKERRHFCLLSPQFRYHEAEREAVRASHDFMDCFGDKSPRKDDSIDSALDSIESAESFAESPCDSPPFAFEKILVLGTSLRSSSLRLAVLLVEFLIFFHKDSGLGVRALWRNAKSIQ